MDERRWTLLSLFGCTSHPTLSLSSRKRRLYSNNNGTTTGSANNTTNRLLSAFPLAALYLLRLITIMASIRGTTGFVSALIRISPHRPSMRYLDDAYYVAFHMTKSRLGSNMNYRAGRMVCSRSSLASDVSPSAVQSMIMTPTTYQIIFDLLVPEGRCVGLTLADVPDTHPDALRIEHVTPNDRDDDRFESSQPHWIHSCLHPDEIRYGTQILHSDSQRRSFWIGRLAMRHALTRDPTPLPTSLSHTHSLSLTDDECRRQSILKDQYGRPRVPRGFLGSISHKGTTGVALVVRETRDSTTRDGAIPRGDDESPPRWGVGVDIEDASGADRRNIARKVLTPHEQANLGHIPGVSVSEEVLLRFSLKESVYKAMHPLICQFVSFQEAEIQPLTDGTAEVTLFLKSGAHTVFDNVQAHWCRHGDFFLSTASVRLKEKEWLIRIQNEQLRHMI